MTTLRSRIITKIISHKCIFEAVLQFFRAIEPKRILEYRNLSTI